MKKLRNSRKKDEKLKKILLEREDMVGKVKESVTAEVKSWKEEREQQQKVNIDKIIRQQQQEHNKDMDKQLIKIIKEKK